MRRECAIPHKMIRHHKMCCHRKGYSVSKNICKTAKWRPVQAAAPSFQGSTPHIGVNVFATQVGHTIDVSARLRDRPDGSCILTTQLKCIIDASARSRDQLDSLPSIVMIPYNTLPLPFLLITPAPALLAHRTISRSLLGLDEVPAVPNRCWCARALACVRKDVSICMFVSLCASSDAASNCFSMSSGACAKGISCHWRHA